MEQIEAIIKEKRWLWRMLLVFIGRLFSNRFANKTAEDLHRERLIGAGPIWTRLKKNMNRTRTSLDDMRHDMIYKVVLSASDQAIDSIRLRCSLSPQSAKTQNFEQPKSRNFSWGWLWCRWKIGLKSIALTGKLSIIFALLYRQTQRTAALISQKAYVAAKPIAKTQNHHLISALLIALWYKEYSILTENQKHSS